MTLSEFGAEIFIEEFLAPDPSGPRMGSWVFLVLD
jgi:hypothetical protein